MLKSTEQLLHWSTTFFTLNSFNSFKNQRLKSIATTQSQPHSGEWRIREGGGDYWPHLCLLPSGGSRELGQGSVKSAGSQSTDQKSDSTREATRYVLSVWIHKHTGEDSRANEVQRKDSPLSLALPIGGFEAVIFVMAASYSSQALSFHCPRTYTSNHFFWGLREYLPRKAALCSAHPRPPSAMTKTGSGVYRPRTSTTQPQNGLQPWDLVDQVAHRIIIPLS